MYSLLLIAAGLLLLFDTFSTMRGLGAVVNALKPFETIVGVVALVAGILNFFSLAGITLIAAGLLLGTRAFTTVPRVGDELERASGALTPFRGLIGGTALVIGVLSIF